MTAGGGTPAGAAGGGVTAGAAGGDSTAGEPGGGAEPGRALGGVGETGASGVGATVLGLDGLKTGGGGGGTGLTVCAWAWPIAQAVIVAASETAASSAAAERSNPIACIAVSFGWSSEPPHEQEMASRAIQTIRSFVQGI